MVPTYSTSLRNRLSAIVPPGVKNFLVAKLFFGPSTGKLIKYFEPKKNLKGLRFNVRSKNIAIGEIANLYFNRRERAELDFVQRHIIDSQFVNIVELGASIGFIAANIIFARKVNYFGIEASPRLAEEARINLRNNNRSNSNYRVENFCIDYSGCDFVEFAESEDSLVGKIGSGVTGVRVKAVRFGDVVRDHHIRDFALIADIEGAEADLLFKDEESLRGCALIVAELEGTDNFSIDDQVRRAGEIGFALKEQFRNVFAFQRR